MILIGVGVYIVDRHLSATDNPPSGGVSTVSPAGNGDVVNSPVATSTPVLPQMSEGQLQSAIDKLWGDIRSLSQTKSLVGRQLAEMQMEYDAPVNERGGKSFAGLFEDPVYQAKAEQFNILKVRIPELKTQRNELIALRNQVFG